MVQKVDIGTLRLKYAGVAILAASTKSAVIDLVGGTLCGLFMPAAFTGTAITFEVSNDVAGTFHPLHDSSGAVSVTVAQQRAYSVNPITFYGWRYIKIVSNAAANGDAGRIVTLAVRDIE